MWKTTCLLIYFTCFVYALPVAAAATCEPSGLKPFVDFTTTPGQAQYFTDKDKNDLIALNRSFGQGIAGWSPVGLTLADRGMTIGVTVRSEKLPDGWYCSEVSSVHASIQYNSIDVYIAREYRRGTCQYNAILDHERRHVGVFHDTLAEFAPRIERKLYAALNKMKPKHNRDHERAAKNLQTTLEKALSPLFLEMDRVTTSRNARLDTKENYTKELENCLSW
jgi:hypothetical protein